LLFLFARKSLQGRREEGKAPHGLPLPASFLDRARKGGKKGRGRSGKEKKKEKRKGGGERVRYATIPP